MADRSFLPTNRNACNRTLHGEAGRTYELQIQNPHGVYPFVCHLNFTATGGLYGDIVQPEG
uniref:Uncharacterized protein n=1 Tax=Anopheles stephensi TaxID=30069 RepID=A0A182YIZ8_ANOST